MRNWQTFVLLSRTEKTEWVISRYNYIAYHIWLNSWWRYAVFKCPQIHHITLFLSQNASHAYCKSLCATSWQYGSVVKISSQIAERIASCNMALTVKSDFWRFAYLFFLYWAGNHLHGYVIKEHQVKNVAECTYHCFKTQPSCKSFNYESGGELLTDKQRKCQLNNATKSSYPHGLVVAETFDYWEIQTDIEHSKVSWQCCCAGRLNF